MAGEVDRTLWCGNLDSRISEELLYELFLQAGPIDKVKIPLDQNKRPKPFAFITFRHAVSVPYTIELLNGISLFDKTLTLQYRPGSVHVSAEGMQNMTPTRDNKTPLALVRSFSAPSMKESKGRRFTEFKQDDRALYNQRDGYESEERRRSGSSREREYRERSPHREYGRSRDGSRDRDRHRKRDRSTHASRIDSESRNPSSLMGAPLSLMGRPPMDRFADHMQPRQYGSRSQSTQRQGTDSYEVLMAFANRLSNPQNQGHAFQPKSSHGPNSAWQQQGYRGNF